MWLAPPSRAEHEPSGRRHRSEFITTRYRSGWARDSFGVLALGVIRCQAPSGCACVGHVGRHSRGGDGELVHARPSAGERDGTSMWVTVCGVGVQRFGFSALRRGEHRLRTEPLETGAWGEGATPRRSRGREPPRPRRVAVPVAIAAKSPLTPPAPGDPATNGARATGANMIRVAPRRRGRQADRSTR